MQGRAPARHAQEYLEPHDCGTQAGREKHSAWRTASATQRTAGDCAGEESDALIVPCFNSCKTEEQPKAAPFCSLVRSSSVGSDLPWKSRNPATHLPEVFGIFLSVFFSQGGFFVENDEEMHHGGGIGPVDRNVAIGEEDGLTEDHGEHAEIHGIANVPVKSAHDE